jgi:hypothetical protein
VAKYKLGPWGQRKTLPQVTRQLEICREKFEAGDTYYLLLAIDLCLRTGRRVPRPFQQAFNDRFLLWTDNRVRSLDEAFGVERPSFRYGGRKRFKFDDAKERARLAPLIVMRVAELCRTRRPPIDDGLFEIVAEELNSTPGYVKKLYNGARNLRAALGLPLRRHSRRLR